MKWQKTSWILGVVGALCSVGVAFSIDNDVSPMPDSPAQQSVVMSTEPAQSIKQGGVLTVKVDIPSKVDCDGLKAKLDGHTLPMFKTAAGHYETLFGISVDTAVGGHTITLTDSTGKQVDKQVIQVADGKFQRQNISVGSSTAGLKPLPGELEAIQALKANVSATRYWTKPFMSPTPDCENSPFGVKRYHNGVYTQDYHKGVDLRSPQGRPIWAIADGVVKISAPQFRLHGGTVGLDHGQGINSVYIHMSKVAVKQGQSVKKGDIIGYVGSTGFATGPHLHWGLYTGGVPVNPDLWIPVPRC